MRLQALAGLEFTACNAPPGRCRSADSASRAGRHFRSPRGHGFAGPSLALGRHKTAIRELPLSAWSRPCLVKGSSAAIAVGRRLHMNFR